MNFLKKNFKFIVILIITIIITSGFTAYATTYLASNVEYTRTGKNVNNVGEALDDLYNTQSGIAQTDATASDILSGKKAYTTEGLVFGNLTSSNNSEKYSTTEQVIGEWINGKPLYRQIVNINGESTTGVKTYTINIPNVQYITIDETHSFLYATTPEYIPIKNIWDAGNTGGYTLLPHKNNVTLQFYRAVWQNLPATITFEYTKTTD